VPPTLYLRLLHHCHHPHWHQHHYLH
jgi:hypothetical protein